MTAERDQAGVTFDALGINGARASRALAWDESIFSAHLAARNPDLIIVAYGTNEAGDDDFNAAIFFRTVHSFTRTAEASVPGASLLVIGPPDRAVRRGQRWTTIATLPIVVAAERRAARQAGVASGTPTQQWAAPDRLRLGADVSQTRASRPRPSDRNRISIDRRSDLRRIDAWIPGLNPNSCPNS
jgi:lysophospholipase L1-like esterase